MTITHSSRPHADFLTSYFDFSNPGTLYNIGNALALAGSIVLCVMTAAQVSGSSLYQHFLGSWPALSTSLATVVFWISGVRYAKAWSKGFPPEAKSNASGHAYSTLGATLIGVTLIGLARTEVSLALAIIATILHVGGKLAAWLAPDSDYYFKPMPLYSRIAYATTLLLDIRHVFVDSQASETMMTNIVLPVFLLHATLFWARADLLLLPEKK